MFDSLHPPIDLGSARSRLRAAVGALAADGVMYLGPPGPAWRSFEPTVRVVVADLVLWSADPADLLALASALGPDRSLVFLEPTAELGWRRLIHRVGRPLWRAGTGHDFEADVPNALRSVGLLPTDLCRFGVGPARSRSYVLGRAISAQETVSPG